MSFELRPVLLAISAFLAIEARASGGLQCGRDNPLGDAPSHAGIGRVPVKIESDGLRVSIRYLAHQGRPEREYLYRVQSVQERSLHLVRVDSAGKDKPENVATMSFDSAVAQKSEMARNASIEWTDTAPTKPPVSPMSPGKSWFFCTGVEAFLKDARERLKAGHP